MLVFVQKDTEKAAGYNFNMIEVNIHCWKDNHSSLSLLYGIKKGNYFMNKWRYAAFYSWNMQKYFPYKPVSAI